MHRDIFRASVGVLIEHDSTGWLKQYRKFPGISTNGLV